MPTRADGPKRVIAGAPVYGGEFRGDGTELLRYVLPGEEVALGPEGAVPQILSGSFGRVEPRCVHFGVCGGCHYQHADYGLQLKLKQQILSDLLVRADTGSELGAAGGLAREITVHSGEPWGYRNRIRLRVTEADGVLRLGYNRPGTNEFLPIRMCPISAGLLWRAAEALLLLANEAGCRPWLAGAAEVELFCTGDQTRLQMTLLMKEGGAAGAGFAGLCGRLQELVPELSGAGTVPHPEMSRRLRRAFVAQSWGAEGLVYAVGEERYWVGRGAFFQVNRFLVDRLLMLVGGGERGGLAWDLYAGVGLFSKALAGRFERVVAVEGGPEAAASLLAASRGGRGKPAFEAVQAATLDFLKARVLERERPDLIVLDPPRAGVGTDGAELLAKIAAPQLIYVSCDPVTLARDLAVLTRNVYRLEAVDMVDLFPQTYHLETVVRLVRR